MTRNSNETDDWEPTDDDGGPPDPPEEPPDASSDPPDGVDGSSDVATTSGPDGATTSGPDGVVSRDRPLAEYVQWALLVILLLLVVVATLRFYFAASTAVDRFVTRQYRPLFQAAFNLVILLAAGVGLSILVRRLS